MDNFQKALIETLASVLQARIREGHYELAAGDIKFTARALDELGRDS